MKPAWSTVLIEIYVPSFEKLRQLYGRIGFKVIRETKPEEKSGSLVLKMEPNVLCFWAGNDLVYEPSYFKQFPRDTKRGYGVDIVIMVAEVKAYFNRVKDFANVVKPLGWRP